MSTMICYDFNVSFTSWDKDSNQKIKKQPKVSSFLHTVRTKGRTFPYSGCLFIQTIHSDSLSFQQFSIKSLRSNSKTSFDD